MLRVRRDVLGQVSAHLDRYGRGQDHSHQRERRGARGCERLRLPDADWRRNASPGPHHRNPAPRRNPRLPLITERCEVAPLTGPVVFGNTRSRVASTYFPMSLHVRPEDRVHARLVAAALSLEPFQYVFVEPQRNRLFPLRHYELGVFKPLAVKDRRSVGIGSGRFLDLLIRHRPDPRPIGLTAMARAWG